MSDSQDILLYHEPQVAKLCAVHCLNTVLQGPYFTEVDLATMAEELDKAERQMMAESGVDSADYLKFMAEDSGNVAADGDFSLQVLKKALEVWTLDLASTEALEATGAALDPQSESAFICHLEQHWFTIRKVGGEWYNFNSLYSAPEHLSPFYLAAYLDTLKDSGWSIFVVRGELPSYRSTSSELAAGYGNWLSPQEARMKRATDAANVASPKAARSSDDDLQAAIRASLGGGSGHGNSQAFGLSDEDADLAAAISASLQER